jgi:hypothetical protein
VLVHLPMRWYITSRGGSNYSNARVSHCSFMKWHVDFPLYFTLFSFSFVSCLHLLHFNPTAAVPMPHTSSLHFSPLFTASPCATLRLFIFFILTQVL